MSLPLNLVIDRTADGKLRAEVAGHPESAVEAADLTGLLNAVQGALHPFLKAERMEAGPVGRDEVETCALAPVPDDVGAALTDEEDAALHRVAMERMPDRETLKKLVARYPVPDRWPEGDEDWDDVP